MAPAIYAYRRFCSRTSGGQEGTQRPSKTTDQEARFSHQDYHRAPLNCHTTISWSSTSSFGGMLTNEYWIISAAKWAKSDSMIWRNSWLDQEFGHDYWATAKRGCQPVKESNSIGGFARSDQGSRSTHCWFAVYCWPGRVGRVSKLTTKKLYKIHFCCIQKSSVLTR